MPRYSTLYLLPKSNSPYTFTVCQVFLFCFVVVRYYLLSTVCSNILVSWQQDFEVLMQNCKGSFVLSESMGRGCVWEGFLETAGFARSSSFPVLFWLIVHRDAQFSSLMECAWIILNCRTLFLIFFFV